ncbi:MAG: FAD-binding domain-containing protein [Paracoccus hibiscisoli]|uniref:FAD-binding domain-containing protein n=1 Tax=Paracoccus hibiscisoli TaxID=2023261 RepID=UPI00391ADEB0
MELTATRAAGLERMRAFQPRMGLRYAQGRNMDHGPGLHRDVSGLSPWLRRRLLTEPEVIAAALAAHGPDRAAKFIQEVVWRSYFKGWLELRPQVWDSYRCGLRADLAALERDDALRDAILRAQEGRTGLDCFDAWARELVATGYLHNHARMWFASIWIFTLRLPWRVGADFFLRHLLDGDAASNTLSWRWVAGLHTRGKPYEAQADNIARLTGGRFAPAPGDLATVTQGLEATEPDGLPPTQPLRTVVPPEPGRPTALLITDDDCCPGDVLPQGLDIRAAVALSAGHLRSPLAVSEGVLAFDAGALADAAARAGMRADPLRAQDPAGLAHWAMRAGVTQIATPNVTQGPVRDWLDAARPHLAAQGIVLSEARRDWDAAVWPLATAGFFKVGQRIPALLDRLIPA